jgi:hypothetical protein
LRKHYSKQINDVREKILSIAAIMAEVIIEKEIDKDENIILQQVKKIIDELDEDVVFKIHINPEYADFLERIKSKLMNNDRSFADTIIVKDDTLEKGDCIFYTSSGMIDAKISSQLEKIKQEIIKLDSEEKEFDVDKTRYGKIIIMADADVDGAHIRTLLLTFFFNYMRDLITKGKLYIAQPPLYKIKYGKTEKYAYDEEQRQQIVNELRREKSGGKNVEVIESTEEENEITEETPEQPKRRDGIVISRFKGLGEMNPEQLWSTTMDPENRTLLKVTVEDANNAVILFQTLMGDSVPPRREFIERNAQYARLDI